MSSACSDIVWIQRLLELGFSQPAATPLHTNNTSEIQIAANPMFHGQTKKIKVLCHYIEDAYDDNAISLPHVSTNLSVADIFTKALPCVKHKFFITKLLLVDSLTSI